MTNTKLSGDALSRAAARAMNRTVQEFDGRLLDEQQYADDPTLLGEMLVFIWKHGKVTMKLETNSARVYLLDDKEWPIASGYGDTPNEAVARCVVAREVLRQRRLLADEPQP